MTAALGTLAAVALLAGLGALAAAVHARRLRGRLAAAQERIAALEADLDAALRPRPPTRPAERAVRAVIGTAARARREGVVPLVQSSLDELASWALDRHSDVLEVAAPDGTLTLLFSDIEDSTALNARLGDRAWVGLLGAHDALLRDCWTRHHGRVVKTAGDGFMVAFRDPSAAVLAARDAQRALPRSLDPRLRLTPVRVRMGVHSGRVISRDGDYFGRDVAMAARVAGCAAGGEVLVSEPTYDAVDDPRLAFEDAGAVELKGLPGTHRLWRLVG